MTYPRRPSTKTFLRGAEGRWGPGAWPDASIPWQLSHISDGNLSKDMAEADPPFQKGAPDMGDRECDVERQKKGREVRNRRHIESGGVKTYKCAGAEVPTFRDFGRSRRAEVSGAAAWAGCCGRAAGPPIEIKL